MPGFGDQRHDLVAVDDRAVLVDDDDPVGVAVEGDADVGTYLMHLLLQSGRMGRAAFLVDVETVGFDVDGDNLGAEFPQRLGRHLVGGAVGAIDNDPQARQRHRARQGALGELDVAVVDTIDALGAAEPVRIGERQLDIPVQHPLDALLDLVGELVAVGTEQLDAVVVVGIVRGRDHHADVGAQRAYQHGDRRRRDRAKQEYVHAGGAQARHHCVLDHIAGKSCVLAEHDAVAMAATLERKASGHADPHGDLRRHRKLVGASPNPVRAEITPCHACQNPRRCQRHVMPQLGFMRSSHCVIMYYESLENHCCGPRKRFGILPRRSCLAAK